MFSSDYVRRIVGGTSMPMRVFGITVAGAVGLGAVTHPGIAAAAISALNTAVTCSTTSACVSGTNTKSGPGVSGTSSSGAGVTATSTSGNGVIATTSSGTGVSGTSKSAHGVNGISTTSSGVFGSTTSGAAGVLGQTVSSYGVFGDASSTSIITSGVYGSSYQGYGVYGQSLHGDGYGVEGDGNTIGVIGTSSAGAAVLGSTSTGIALEGISASTTSPALSVTSDGEGGRIFANSSTDGVYLSNSGPGEGITVEAETTQGDDEVAFNAITAPSGFGFGSINNSTGEYVFFVNGVGDLTYTGTLTNVVRATGGSRVASYSSRSAAPTIEDNGSAQLVGGFAAVRLDPTFAATIDPRVVYHVIITPDGDTRGLYVAAKTPSGFTVRESQGGRSTVSFDYRVVAEANGQAGVRMAALTRPVGPHPYSVSAAVHVRSNPTLKPPLNVPRPQ